MRQREARGRLNRLYRPATAEILRPTQGRVSAIFRRHQRRRVRAATAPSLWPVATQDSAATAASHAATAPSAPAGVAPTAEAKRSAHPSPRSTLDPLGAANAWISPRSSRCPAGLGARLISGPDRRHPSLCSLFIGSSDECARHEHEGCLVPMCCVPTELSVYNSLACALGKKQRCLHYLRCPQIALCVQRKNPLVVSETALSTSSTRLPC